MLDCEQLGEAFGFEIRAELIPDSDTRVDDYDSYGDVDIKAWRDDEWFFVGVVVTASLNGHDLGSSSLWGLEYGWLPTAGGFVNPIVDSYKDDYLPDLIIDATCEAMRELSKLSDSYENIKLSEV